VSASGSIVIEYSSSGEAAFSINVGVSACTNLACTNAGRTNARSARTPRPST
jgi:hypothetical protein